MRRLLVLLAVLAFVVVSPAEVTAQDTSEETGLGYRLIARDGGVFVFGNRTFEGSTGDITLNQPIVAGTTNRESLDGYLFVARDGGMFAFGDAEFHGSAADKGRTDFIDMDSLATGMGY